MPIINGIGNYMMSKKVEITGLKTGRSLERTFNDLANRKGVKEIGEIKTMPIVIPAVDIKEAKEYIFTNSVPNVENKEKYITHIRVGKAVRASSSFPAVFCPCEFETHQFMDGGVLDNVPVIEVKKQGVDKVIAINFKSDEVDSESNIMDLTMRTIDIMGNKISKESLEKSDLVITIKTDKTGLLDVEKLDSCYEYGYKAIIENLDKIKQVLKDN